MIVIKIATHVFLCLLFLTFFLLSCLSELHQASIIFFISCSYCRPRLTSRLLMLPQFNAFRVFFLTPTLHSSSSFLFFLYSYFHFLNLLIFFPLYVFYSLYPPTHTVYFLAFFFFFATPSLRSSCFFHLI